MRQLLRALLATIVVGLAIATPSGAIVNGTPDTAHPYVGILVTEIDGARVPVCSGFLVRPTVFVTAAHCTEFLGDSLPAYVAFEQAFTDASPLVHGTSVVNPAYDPAAVDSHDIGLVVLDEPVADRGFARLPASGVVGALDRRKKSQEGDLTIVGYGANAVYKTKPPTYDFQLVRNMAPSRLLKLPDAKAGGADIEISSKQKKGYGALCFGDSGGPVLLGSSDVVVGINSYVKNRKCAGSAFAYRMDLPGALGFLAPYL
jgi:secreted trypsin-like serine protease